MIFFVIFVTYKLQKNFIGKILIVRKNTCKFHEVLFDKFLAVIENKESFNKLCIQQIVLNI